MTDRKHGDHDQQSHAGGGGGESERVEASGEQVIVHTDDGPVTMTSDEAAQANIDARDAQERMREEEEEADNARELSGGTPSDAEIQQAYGGGGDRDPFGGSPREDAARTERYQPQGRTDESSYDYDDDPQALALKFSQDQLESALAEAEPGDTSVVLKFDYEENVPIQAVQEAVEAGQNRSQSLYGGGDDWSNWSVSDPRWGKMSRAQKAEQLVKLGVPETEVRKAWDHDEKTNTTRGVDWLIKHGDHDQQSHAGNGGGDSDDRPEGYAMQDALHPGEVGQDDRGRPTYRVESESGASFRVTAGVPAAGERDFVVTATSEYGIEQVGGGDTFEDAVGIADRYAEGNAGGGLVDAAFRQTGIDWREGKAQAIADILEFEAVSLDVELKHGDHDQQSHAGGGAEGAASTREQAVMTTQEYSDYLSMDHAGLPISGGTGETVQAPATPSTPVGEDYKPRFGEVTAVAGARANAERESAGFTKPVVVASTVQSMLSVNEGTAAYIQAMIEHGYVYQQGPQVGKLGAGLHDMVFIKP